MDPQSPDAMVFNQILIESIIFQTTFDQNYKKYNVVGKGRLNKDLLSADYAVYLEIVGEIDISK